MGAPTAGSGEQLGAQVLFGAEAAGGEAGGIERGVGVRQRIRARALEPQ